MEAVLSVKIQESWVDQLVSEHPDITIRILDVINMEETHMGDLVEIGIPDGYTSEEIQGYVKEIKGVESIDLEKIDRDKLLGIVKTSGCIGCRAIRESKCYLLAASTDTETRVRWKLIFSKKAHLQKLVWMLNEHGVDVKLVKLSSVDESKGLTAKQEQIIKVAFERGYYDFPKRIGIRELSEMFDVSTASLSETLRRGQRKIIEGYFTR